jgi:uncharacterized membrane protein YvbJ
MFCIDCGTNLPEAAKFCSGCGKSLAQPSATQSDGAATAVAPARVPLTDLDTYRAEQQTEVSPEMKVIRVVSLLITGALLVYIFTVRITDVWLLIVGISAVITFAVFMWPAKKVAA